MYKFWATVTGRIQPPSEEVEQRSRLVHESEVARKRLRAVTEHKKQINKLFGDELLPHRRIQE